MSLSNGDTQVEKVNIDVPLVRRLVTSQFPQWADLPIKPVEFGGWDNRTFHLGDRMTVRMPSAAPYALEVEKEQAWLPRLAPLLPLPIPTPLGLGVPAEGYPWPWSIYRWIEGEVATRTRIADMGEFASELASFLVALYQVDATDGPLPGLHNFYRGGPLTTYDGETRRAIKTLGDRIDTEAVSEVWEAALASTWDRPPVWFHGDVAPGNLLVRDGRLSAVIDFGTSGVGDPACDLVIAWTLFEGESRDVFRSTLPFDEGTWARGRGWALWKALITMPGVSPGGGSGTIPLEARNSARVLDEVLDEHRRTG